MPVRHPPRRVLANLPTPLVRLRRLEREVGARQILLKRDDLTGLELSGNKVRKLEYIVADTLARGCDTLVTEGTPQSNHCRATAAACARVGLRCRLLLRPPPPPGPPLGNHLLDLLFGARVSAYERAHFEEQRDRIVADVLREERAAGHVARFTPMGASEPLACWGYIRAAAELAEQLGRLRGGCDIVVPISSGGTYAGLVLGKLIHHLDDWTLWAVPVSDAAAYHRARVERLCAAAIDEFKLPARFDPAAINLIDGYVGQGYAVPLAPANDAARLLACCEAVVLDPVYTAKAFCALLDGIRAGRFGRKRPVVFIHTGGIFSNFAWPETLVPQA